MSSRQEKSSKCEYGQGRILCCQMCGHTWTTMNPAEVRGPNCKCAPCIYLEMARRHAQEQGTTLKRAVKRFLDGMAKKEATTREHIWEG